jgi:hypothetical protein
MVEKLTIKNFGPIKDVTLELRAINILIGDQGTGKSTIVKLISAIKSNFFRDIFDVPDNTEDRSTKVFLKHLENFGIEKLVRRDTKINFESNDFLFSFSGEKITNFEASSYLTDEQKISFNFTYIPAERVMIPALADALFGLMQEKVVLPHLFLRFGNKFQSSRKEKPDFSYLEILQVDYSHINGIDYVLLKDGSKIFLTDASSGMQGAIPLLVVLDSINSYNYAGARQKITAGGMVARPMREDPLTLLIVEEPELNLFPETQNKLLKYALSNNLITDNEGTPIMTDKNKNCYKNSLFITTHSPYIITSLNNMMYSYEVGQKHAEEVDKIIEKKYWLNPEDVSAYMLFKDGFEDIIDRQEGMIQVERIDEVSRKLNSDFDLLQNIELGVNA